MVALLRGKGVEIPLRAIDGDINGFLAVLQMGV